MSIAMDLCSVKHGTGEKEILDKHYDNVSNSDTDSSPDINNILQNSVHEGYALPSAF